VKGIILIETYEKSSKRETGSGKKYVRVTCNRPGNYMDNKFNGSQKCELPSKKIVGLNENWW
jgi:hypothetical protein